MSPLGIERERVGALPMWGWTLIVSAAVWGLYVLTLGPSTAFWDTSEYIATAYIVGIPHPPGNPFFVMLGRVWIVVLEWTGLSVAARVNLLAATASAAAAGFWFLAVVRVWAHFARSRAVVLTAGVAAVIVGATAYTVWTQSNVNEKVYTVSLMFVAIITYLAMLWEDHSDDFRGDRIVILVAFLLGLGATNHLMSVLPVLALGVFLVWHAIRTLMRWKLLGMAAVAALVGFSLQILFVPIRSAQDPIIDEADPECETLWNAVTPVFFPDEGGLVDVQCEALDAALDREQYAKPPLGERQSPFTAQLRMYFQYFDWQWARTLSPPLRAGVTIVFILLGAIGLVRHWRGDPDSFVYFGVLMFIVTLLLIYYLNFEYGYSLYGDIPVDQHEVRERDYFYLVSFNLWGLYAGMGLAAVWQRLAEVIRGSPDASRPGGAGGGGAGRWDRASLLSSPVLLIALVPLVFNWPLASKRGDFAARDWAYNLLQSVEPYGILFTNGDNDTFPLWYLQEVEGIRRDVTVIVHSYLGTEWYPRQLRDLTRPCPEGVNPLDDPTVIICQRPWEAEDAVAPYRDMEVEPPTETILPMSNAELAAVPAYEILPQSLPVPFSEAVTVQLPSGHLLTRPDFLVFYIIRNNLGERPIYFASTAPPVFGAWRLSPHLLREGLAHELVNHPLESSTDTVDLRAEYNVQWIERERSSTLLWDVFQVDYLLDWDIWPEASTRLSIPAQYYLAYMALGDAQELRENPDLAARNYERARQFIELTDRGVP